MTERVSPKDIRTGDVISFQSYLGLPKGKSAETNIGIVMNNHEKDGNLLGFDVFPLTEHEQDQYVPNDDTHYMIGRRDTLNIGDMGLDTDKNYRLNYKGHIVPNNGEYLNTDGKGGVTRLGSLTGSTLLGYIIERSLKSENNHGAFFGSSAEMTRLKGSAPSMSMVKIQESQSVEQGKSLKIERERQDFSSEDTQTITKAVKSDTSIKKIRKKRANTPHGEGKIRDISLNDATKISLIPEGVAEFFSQAHDARRKPLETLKQVFDLSDKNPELIQRWQERANEAGNVIEDAQTAWFSFMKDVTSSDPEKLEKYNNVETYYAENAHG
ncbi:MAG: hypothetical protein ACRBCK_08285 [Alphaproteobacteria bacterium]